jgi:hypothetical protein
LLWCESAAQWDDRCEIAAIEIGSFDIAVVRVGIAHIGPIDVAGRDVDDDTIRMSSTFAYDGFQIRAVWIQ